MLQLDNAAASVRYHHKGRRARVRTCVRMRPSLEIPSALQDASYVFGNETRLALDEMRRGVLNK